MQPLIVLLVTFFVLRVVQAARKRFTIGRTGLIAMGVMLLFTAIGHFKYAKGMALMIPSIFPNPELITTLTGIFEVVAGILLINGKFTKPVVWLVLLFVIAILPANINAAFNNVNIQEANYTGPGRQYLWFRLPLQIFFILWIYFSYKSGIRKTDSEDHRTP